MMGNTVLQSDLLRGGCSDPASKARDNRSVRLAIVQHLQKLKAIHSVKKNTGASDFLLCRKTLRKFYLKINFVS